MSPEKPFCSAKRKDGGECHGWPDSTGLCPAHRPGAHELHVYAGKCRSKQHQLETRLNPRLRPVLDLLANAIKETHTGTLQPARAQAMASLASALIKVTEFAELEARLTSLEKRLNGGKK
jgi:hypothetical protein